MQRDQYISVTIPVLVHCKQAKSDGRATWEHGLRRLRPVRALKPSDLRTLPFKGPDRELWLGVIGLVKALQANDSLGVEKAYLRLSGLKDPMLKTLLRDLAGRSTTYAKDELSRLVSAALSGVEVKLWWSGKRYLPAILCPDLRTAFYVKTLLSIVGGKALLVCPHCCKAFAQERSDQDYCSVSCREAHRVARWRAKNKQIGNQSNRSPQKSKHARKSRRKKQ